MKVYDFKGNVIYDDPVLQKKIITENGTYSADEGYDGMSEVTINVESQAEKYDGSHVYFTKLHDFYGQYYEAVKERPYVYVEVDDIRWCYIYFSKKMIADGNKIRTNEHYSAEIRLPSIPLTVDELVSAIINHADYVDETPHLISHSTYYDPPAVLIDGDSEYYSAQIICTNFDHNLVGSVATLRFDE